MTEQETLLKAELDKINAALYQKRYTDARAHCRAAEQNGAPRGEVQRWERAIKTGDQQQVKLTRNAGWVGGLIAISAYFLLAFLPLPSPVHFGVALLLIPAVCGLAVGRLAGFDFGASSRFRRAAYVGASAMFAYGLCSMIWRRTRFDLGSEAGQVFFVWLVAAGVYALIAGLVAGIFGGKLAWLTSGRNTHGTAS